MCYALACLSVCFSQSFLSWLVRLSKSSEEGLEDSNCFKDRVFLHKRSPNFGYPTTHSQKALESFHRKGTAARGLLWATTQQRPSSTPRCWSLLPEILAVSARPWHHLDLRCSPGFLDGSQACSAATTLTNCTEECRVSDPPSGLAILLSRFPSSPPPRLTYTEMGHVRG